jgi:post-segregation antitoxin (ccd killing protein)
MTIHHIEAAVTAMKTRFKTAPVPERIRLAKCLLAFERYLAKANPTHDLLGRFAASETGKAETALSTLPEAVQYYQDHLAGVWRLTIQRKAGTFDVKVNFNENQDHAYTKTNKDTGTREFDAVRAEFMPKMLDTISAPDVILQNGNRDLFIEKQMNGVHYAVVLEWKDSAKEYRFRSAHCWDKMEYDRNKKNYTKPAVRGRKVGQKKAPERLSKSSGADSTFTHLRDTFEKSQTPPTCQSALVQLNELGGELAETSSCYPKASIDGFTDFVKAIDWQTIALEPFNKANSHHDEHGRFASGLLGQETNLPSSESISTLQEATHYYQNHIAGIWQVTIQRKAGNFSAKLNLNDNKDHAYTKTNEATGLREFDVKRARLMQHLFNAITKPDVILQNGSRDLFIEKQIDGLHYAVVLEWKESANEYRFRSAHPWSKEEFNNNLKTYNRPLTRGKKTDKNISPKRLSKSLGETTTFSHLRDSTALLQSPPKHNCTSDASLVNSLEPGDAPVLSGIGWRFAFTDSIDRFTDFVKAIDWQTITLEPLQKANSHHDGLGRFAKNNDNHPYLPKSDDINTLQEAKAYFSNHIAGHWRITIHRKSGCFSAIINFNENQNHAYTKADKTTGKRNFDQQRARLMQHLIETISKPDIILENGNRDVYIEKQKTDSYYAVVLEWRNDAKEYRFRSAHCWDKKEYDRNVQTYRRPKARGSKLEKNKAPERLKKSFGASTAFTRLRDMIEELQPSPDCRSVVGQLNESGWELAETSSCYPKASIDEFQDFVKAIDWQTITLEPFHKANSHHDKSGRFAASDGEPARLAPNGKPSNLTAVQWEQVRTTEFKRWFGDWDLAAAKPIREAYNFNQARNAVKQFQNKPLENTQTGMIVTLSRNNLDKMLSSKAVGKSESAAGHSLAVANVDDLFRRSVLGWSKPDRAGNTNITAIHRFFAPLNVYDHARLVKMTVKEFASDNQGNKVYSVESIEFDELTPAAQWVDATIREDNLDPISIRSAEAVISLAKRVQDFKGDSSKDVDENGEPLASKLAYYLAGADNPDTDEYPFHKAHNHDTPHDIFEAHENPFIRGLVEDYYESGMLRVSALRVALNQWLAGQRQQLDKAGLSVPEELLYASVWHDAEAGRVTDYLAGIHPDAFTVKDLSLLTRLLVRNYLPSDVLIDEALTQSAQSLMMGAVQAHWQASHEESISLAQVAALRATLPTTLEAVVQALRLAPVAKACLDYGAVRAAENIVALSREARASIQQVLMAHALKKQSGDHTATPQYLEQRLGDTFANLNRDWRRIALTETGEMSLQGFVAAQALGTKLKRIEQYRGACGFCKKVDGMVMEVVDPELPVKDGRTQIWVGKTNIDRASSARKRTEAGLVARAEHELWWLAAGVIHPHCRGLWVRVQ